MSSVVGYQPTLSTEMGFIQERITSTKKGSITSIQAVYVLADDLTDLATATTFARLDATTVLSKRLATKGIYLAIGPLDSTSTMLQHYERCDYPSRTGGQHDQATQTFSMSQSDMRIRTIGRLNSALGNSSRNSAKTHLIVSTSVCDLRNQDDVVPDGKNFVGEILFRVGEF
ncbi:hypothetical protein CXB51_017210 [Gossypium anomalum]|uniref:H(+)-transporting two-sector ATPase n=1 Tax=Gossypium anomalum TaxID=47600 RepID=A0A8J6CVR0_9ROSI|nr:hypothetical protein CXB51_017210 [Gossypium anomalum]